jgi:hypothetical protein
MHKISSDKICRKAQTMTANPDLKQFQMQKLKSGLKFESEIRYIVQEKVKSSINVGYFLKGYRKTRIWYMVLP